MAATQSGSTTKPLTVVVAGGGTAGHIEPAMAVADALRQGHDAHVIALGTPKGLDQELIPQRGYQLHLIPPVPIPRKPSPALLTLPLKVAAAIRSAAQVIKGADAVIGFGGYVAAPAYLAAAITRTPFFVHEANARAGLANKLGVALGGTGLNTVANSGLKGEVVGIPIKESIVLAARNRAEIRSASYEVFGLDPSKKTILVTGGSQGARSINEALAGAVDQLVAKGYQVLHAYGAKNTAPVARPGYVPVPYIDKMPAALAVADVIICRSGAMTVAEVTAAGIPAIYIPLPIGNGEQALNVTDVVGAGGARVIVDSDATPELLVSEVSRILDDPAVLERMAAVTRALDRGDAAVEIANRVAEAASTKRAK